MLKLSMKKLGTPDSDPPSVDGSGGVSADGDTGFAPGRLLVGRCAAGVLAWTWASVGGCACCRRTSGTGGGVVASLVVVVVVVPDGAGTGAGVGVLGVDGAGCDGGGAGTVVVCDAGAEVSCAGTVAGTSASAGHAGISAASTATIGSSVVVGGLRII